MNHGSLQAYVDRAERPTAAAAAAPDVPAPATAPHPLGGQYVPIAEPAVPGLYASDAVAGAPGSYTGAPVGDPGRYTDVASA
ncbi:hypothetical protein GCM10017608_30810 [Agromyces luteolus]|uniref:Uncharacterized protein n=1 Tax=Agromyces luteolus TaxID=88373 RepID=A0A7C9LDZ3_9MICO|nr:hypothetical protein [Agromyces luteolus]MUN07531.1 hypothetical protein [Agromyces luteolus]GLK29145.1 hypothetical protein GCM10017608_30810 [Agromyces luteolus]